MAALRKDFTIVATALGLMLGAACGGSAGNDATSTAAGTPAAASAATAGGSPASGATPDGGSPAGASATAGTPAADPTEQVLRRELQRLHPFLLTAADVPFGYRIRNDQPIAKQDIVSADIGIPALAIYVKNSDLSGAWATFYTREQPSSALSSIAYQFGAPASAAALVSTIAGLTTADYAAATVVERVQADRVGDVSQMMRYRIPGARTLEYTWAQGNLAGQIELRYSGDIESPDDAAQIVALAAKQAALMAAAPP